jgi:hypothetical protein
MKILMLLMLEILFTNLAFGDTPQACPATLAGKIACVAGEKMLCNKEFDPAKSDFKYEWHAVNMEGQTFDVFSPFYKKVPGYTPATCSDTKPETDKSEISKKSNT